MDTRRRIMTTLVAVAIGVTVAIGTPGVAGATTTHGSRACAAAERRVPVLEGRQTKLEAQLTASQHALARAQAKHRTALANRLQARVDNLQLASNKVGTALDRIHSTCG